MKKRRLLGTVGTAVILLLVFICSFAAVGAAGKYVIDDAQLLTDEQEAQLSQQIQDLRQEKNIDIVIVTKNGLGEKTPQQYADDYLDQGGYGMGADENSILYLIDMESRELYLSTHGAAEDYFTPELIEEMLDHIYDQVTVQNYYGAAQAFVADAGRFDGPRNSNSHMSSGGESHGGGGRSF